MTLSRRVEIIAQYVAMLENLMELCRELVPGAPQPELMTKIAQARYDAHFFSGQHSQVLQTVSGNVQSFLNERATDVCRCGHLRRQHIYHEGACRPGFLCEARCQEFFG